MYKVVVSDLDGTLLSSNHEVSEFSKKTIKELINNGIQFYIATGRAYPDAKRIMKTIGINIPLISANGAVINDIDGNEIFRNDLDKKHSDIVLNIDYKSISDLIHMNIYSDNKWFMVEKNKKYDPFNCFDENAPKLEYMFEIISLDKIRSLPSITKFYYTAPHEELLKLEKAIIEATNNEINIAFTNPSCLEIFHKNVTKANAIKKIGEFNNFSIDEVIAFGDGFNDFDMINSVGRGFIMKNAALSLKEALPHKEIAPYNYNHGVALKLIELFDLNIENIIKNM